MQADDYNDIYHARHGFGDMPPIDGAFTSQCRLSGAVGRAQGSLTDVTPPPFRYYDRRRRDCQRCALIISSPRMGEVSESPAPMGERSRSAL